VGGELEDGALAVRAGRDDADIGRVVNGDDDTGGQDNLLPKSNGALADCAIEFAVL
jgi:hypothetical protein